MYKHILVPTDGSKLSLKAAKEAAALAKQMKAKITALHVMAPYVPPLDGYGLAAVPAEYSPEAHWARAHALADRALAQVQATARSAKVACDTVSVASSAPWEAIVGNAKSRRCDVIVMASHGRGSLKSVVLGSETHKVLAHTKKPVLVCR
jgi:nucleotide-binding universal stress UspA family protein